jgi:hypothetical protein
MTNRMDRWWQVVGEVAPTDLVDARLQLHWAAQVLPEAGASFAALPAGHWRTEGFTGATLTASEIAAAADQPGVVLEFLDGALAVGRELAATRGGAR